MFNRSWPALASLGLLVLTGCGSAASGGAGDEVAKTQGSAAGAPAGTAPGANVSGSTVSGYVLSPSFNGSIPNMDNIRVVVLDPNTDPPTELGGINLNGNSTACKDGACPFSVPNVDLSRVSGDLVVHTIDTRTTGAQWVSVASITADHTAVEAAVESGKLEKQYVFAVNGNGLIALAKVSKTATPTDLVTKGAFIGVVVGSPNELNPLTGAPPFISGATVAPPTGVAISYPDDAFDASGKATANSGSFIGVPSATPVTASFAVKPGATDKTHTWAAQEVTIGAGRLLVKVIGAQ